MSQKVGFGSKSFNKLRVKKRIPVKKVGVYRDTSEQLNRDTSNNTDIIEEMDL